MVAVRFLQSWRMFPRNSEVEMVDGVAETLIKRNICERLGGALPPPIMAHEPPTRKRGRPRKVRL